MTIAIPGDPPVEGLIAGLFVAKGDPGTRHPQRILDSHELILVRSGTLDIREGADAYRVGPGQTLLLTAGREHAGTADYPADLSFYWLHFRLPRAHSAAGPRLRTFSTPRRAGLLMEMLHRYLDDRTTGMATDLSSGLLAHLILAEVAREAPAPVDLASTHLVGRAEAWIGQHYQDGLSTRDMARHLGCTADHVGRVFRRVTGSTVVDAINRRRLDEAGRRLLTTAEGISAIALRVGFLEPVHFRRLFKRLHGVTPGEFRSLHARAYVNSD